MPFTHKMRWGVMALLWKVLLAFWIAAAVLILCWYLRGVMLTPVRRGRNQDITMHIKVSGPAPELEETVDGLLWLLSDGVLPGRIILEDQGMDEETREIARRLAECNRKVALWTKELDWN